MKAFSYVLLFFLIHYTTCEKNKLFIRILNNKIIKNKSLSKLNYFL